MILPISCYLFISVASYFTSDMCRLLRQESFLHVGFSHLGVSMGTSAMLLWVTHIWTGIPSPASRFETNRIGLCICVT